MQQPDRLSEPIGPQGGMSGGYGYEYDGDRDNYSRAQQAYGQQQAYGPQQSYGPQQNYGTQQARVFHS